MHLGCSYCGRPTGGGSICPVCIQLFQGPRLDELRDAVTTVVETYRRNENAIATLTRQWREGFHDPVSEYARAREIAGALASGLDAFDAGLTLQQEIHAGLLGRVIAGQESAALAGIQRKVEDAFDGMQRYEEAAASALRRFEEVHGAADALKRYQEQLALTDRTAADLLAQTKAALETRWLDEFKAQDAAFHAWLRQSQQEQQLLYERLREAFDAVTLKPDLALYAPDPSDLLRAAATTNLMPEAFLDPSTSYALASMAALSEAIETDPFSADTAAAIRGELGDAPPAPPEDGRESEDSSTPQPSQEREGDHAREPDQRLAAAPPQAIPAILAASGVAPAPPPLALDFTLEHTTPAASDEDLATAGAAFMYLDQLESQLRALIERRLSPRGPRWFEQCCPEPALVRCRDRRQKRRRPNDKLLLYADLGDLKEIICRRDNWEVFAPYFQNKEDLAASFNRLIPFRNDVMHHRRTLVGNELYYFYVEVHRIWKAMDIPDPDQTDAAAGDEAAPN